MADPELEEYYAALRGDVDPATDERVHAALQDPDSSLSRKLRALEEARKDRPNPFSPEVYIARWERDDRRDAPPTLHRTSSEGAIEEPHREDTGGAHPGAGGVADAGFTLPFEKPTHEGRPGKRQRLPAFSRFAAAATVLIAAGVLLGRGSVEWGRGFPLATATITFAGGRGGEAPVPGVEIESNFKGFAAVLALLPGQPDRPVTFPSVAEPLPPEKGDLAVAPGAPANTGPFPEAARAAVSALVVVTETPCGDVLEKGLSDRTFDETDLAGLERAVRDLLAEKNFQRVAVSRLRLKAP